MATLMWQWRKSEEERARRRAMESAASEENDLEVWSSYTQTKRQEARASTRREVQVAVMRLTNPAAVPVYTISGSSTARPLPDWLARKRKRSLKNDPEFASRVELLQDFEFEEASCCIRVSEDGEWVMSTGMPRLPRS
ncbi:hypothetical protein GP486_005555 [Trichoglossum hirsutum]|uniref:Uncharacterized protein n=1 Tax=Trichoglossum hirsutum TaxID=265104 RepID=A0A9P8L910_9PEZI|nr:hypothetical protein GP486_005555 [Trichoglossum hirsutum]